MNIYKKFARDTTIYGIASVLPRLVNVLLLSLHISVLLPKAYSINTKFYVYIAFFNVLFTYGMETAFFRFFTLLDKDPKVLKTAFTSLLSTGIVFSLLLLYFHKQTAAFIGITPDIFLLFVLILFFDTLMVIPYAYLRVTHRPLRFAFYRIFNISVYALFNLVFLLWLPHFLKEGGALAQWYYNHPKVYYIFFSNLIASVSTFLLFLPVLLHFRLGVDRALWLRMLRYGLPIMIAGTFYIINENFDKIALDRLAGPDIMGSYAAVYKIGVFMVLFITAFRLGAEPFYFNQSKDPDAPRQYANIMLAYVILAGTLMVSVVVFLPWIVKIFIRKEAYLRTLGMVPVILYAYLFLGVYFNLSIWYKLTHKTLYGTLFSAVGATITVLINLYGIPRIGYMASAYATLAAYLVMAAISYFLGKRYYAIPYQTGKILIYIAISGFVSWLIFRYFYTDWTVKLLILAAFAGLIYGLEQKTVKHLLQSIRR